MEFVIFGIALCPRSGSEPSSGIARPERLCVEEERSEERELLLDIEVDLRSFGQLTELLEPVRSGADKVERAVVETLHDGDIQSCEKIGCYRFTHNPLSV